MLSKADYIELQTASLSLVQVIIFNKICPFAWRWIIEGKYKRYFIYMVKKEDLKKAREKIWEQIQSGPNRIKLDDGRPSF